MERQCPYCSGEMKPCSTMVYKTANAVRVADWVRCVRCNHATVVNQRGLFNCQPAAQNPALAFA